MTKTLPPTSATGPGRHHSELGSSPAVTKDDAGELDLDQIQAATMLPEQLLQPGEVIVLLLKPSPWYILLASLRGLAIIAVLTILALLLNSYGWDYLSGRDIITIAVGVAGVRLFWQFLQWLSRVYVLTDRRMIRVMGVVRVQVFECQLKQIQHTDTQFSLRERLFALGTIGFATAGTAVAEAYWVMISNPLDVHQHVVKNMNRYR